MGSVLDRLHDAKSCLPSFEEPLSDILGLLMVLEADEAAAAAGLLAPAPQLLHGVGCATSPSPTCSVSETFIPDHGFMSESCPRSPVQGPHGPNAHILAITRGGLTRSRSSGTLG